MSKTIDVQKKRSPLRNKDHSPKNSAATHSIFWSKKSLITLAITAFLLSGVTILLSSMPMLQQTPSGNNNQAQLFPTDVSTVSISSVLPEQENATVAVCNGIKAEVVQKEAYCQNIDNSPVHKQTLTLFYPDSTTEEIFTTRHPAELYDEPEPAACPLGGENLSDISFSPNCQHLRYNLNSWEWTDEFIVNIENKKNVFKTNEKFGYLGEIVWAPDETKYVVVELPNVRAGRGESALHASNPADPDEFVLVWKNENDENGSFWLYGTIENVRFLDNDTVTFRAVLPQFPGIDPSEVIDKTFVYTFSTDAVKEL